MSIPQNHKEAFAVRIWKKEGQSGFADNLSFHPLSGQLISRIKFEDKTAGDKLNDITSGPALCMDIWFTY